MSNNVEVEYTFDDTPAVHGNLKSWLASTEHYPLLTSQQEARLAALVAQGDTQAAETFTASNLRLVVSIAKRYVRDGVPLLDLVQEGNIGLMKAVAKFDHTKGYRFSTYATWWIKQAITNALTDRYRVIRVPIHVDEAARKLLAIATRLGFELGRDATFQEIADAANEGKGMMLHGVRFHMTAVKVAEMRALMVEPVSLDMFFTSSTWNEETFGLDLEDHQAVVPGEGNVESMAQCELVERALLSLKDKRWRRVIELRYGLDRGGPMRTHREVAALLGDVTLKRVQQIEVKAMTKMRKVLRAEQLREAS